MDKHRVEQLQFELAQQIERLARREETGEAAVTRWIDAGVPYELATEAAQKTTDDKGFIDPALFTQFIDDRLRAADAVRLLLNKSQVQ